MGDVEDKNGLDGASVSQMRLHSRGALDEPEEADSGDLDHTVTGNSS